MVKESAKSEAKEPILSTLVAELRQERPDLSLSDIALLERLLDNREAIAIFERMDTEGYACWRILRVCLQANELLHSFKQIIDNLKRVLGDSKRLGELETLDRAIQQLSKFVEAEVSVQPASWLLTRIETPPEAVARMKGGLTLISDAIRVSATVARETRSRLGATRNTNGKAAERAAVGWLAEGVRGITGKANEALAVELATLIVGPDVTIDQVHGAAQTRDREWRQP